MGNALVELKKQNENLNKCLVIRDEEIELLREQIRLLKARFFGPKTEKSAFLLDQPDLFELDPVVEPESEPEDFDTDDKSGNDDQDEKNKLKKGKDKEKREQFPKHLPRRIVDHDLSAEEKECGCGNVKCEISHDKTREMAYKPAILEVLIHIWHNYACPDCKGEGDFNGEPGVTSPARPRMIPGSMANESLLAHIMTAKYADGLPFYRITAQMKRLGLSLSRATMSNWSRNIGEKLAPLWQMLLDEIKKNSCLQMDETTLQVMKEMGKANQSTSYIWVMRGGPPGKEIILFKYDPSRAGKVAGKLLEGYEGIVQTDGYKGYNFIGSELCPMTHAADWNHTRRKFADVVKAMGKRKRSKQSYAAKALGMIRKLYRIERRIRKANLELEDVCRVRREEARPVIDKLFSFLEDLRDKTPPKGLLGNAVNYALTRREGLLVCLEHGEMPIDTNLVENAIRPFVVGRKAWLFSGSPAGAQASAIIYSMVETAKANGWKPDAYLLHLFQNLPKAETKVEKLALLPTVPPQVKTASAID